MGILAQRGVSRPRLVIAATAAVASLTLAACSTSTPVETTPTATGTATTAPIDFAGQTLDVWFPGNNQTEIDLVNDTIIPAFEAETGATVNVTFVDWGDMSTKLNAAFAAGTAPDVFGHGPAAAPDFVANDRLVPLTDYMATLSADDLADLAGVLPGGQVDGTQYLIPLSAQGSLIMYDADAFTAAGLDPDSPPSTWEDLRKAAEKLTERDGAGAITRSGLLLTSQATARQQVFTALLYGEGGTMLGADGMAAWDSTEGVDALDFFAGLYSGDDAVSTDLGADYLNSPAAQQPLVLGTAAMTMLGAPQMKQVLEAAPDKDLRVMPPLSFAGNNPAALGGAGPGLMINADSKVQDLAWTFISYMISPDASTEYTEGIGAVPIRASAVDSDYVKGSPVIQAFLAASPYWVTNPNVVGWVQIRTALDAELEKALNKAETSQDALSAAADEANKIIESNG